MTTALIILVALIGVPLFAVMGFSAIVSYRSAEELSSQTIILYLHELTKIPLLESLPLFAFSGYLLARSGAPGRLLRLSNAAAGWLPGGLAIVAIWLCTLVTALTGASGVTIVALGGLLLPAMLETRYPEKFSLGILTAGGSLGLLFPPSLPIILYGVVSGQSIEKLFRAALVPGLLLLALLSCYAAVRGVRDRVPRTRFSGRELAAALRSGIFEALLPVGVIGGIYSGFFTLGEAAVVSTVYLLIVEVAIFREVKLREIGSIARDSFVLVGGILLILGMSMAVTNYFVHEQIPRQLFASVEGWMTSRTAFLLSLNVFLLLVGCMIDIYAAIALVVPLVIPIAQEFGIDGTHLGIVFLVNMAIGYATPPVGLNLFIASVRFKRPILTLYWACLPIIAVLLVGLATITFVPQVSLWLVDDPQPDAPAAGAGAGGGNGALDELQRELDLELELELDTSTDGDAR